jgi:hypothetical protein
MLLALAVCLGSKQNLYKEGHILIRKILTIIQTWILNKDKYVLWFKKEYFLNLLLISYKNMLVEWLKW